MEITLLVLLVLSFPVIAIAGLVIAIGARDRVRTLEQRFADFQRARPADSAALPPLAVLLTRLLPPPAAAWAQP
jgi:hypothetical protein